jgi:hypothetical protein
MYEQELLASEMEFILKMFVLLQVTQSAKLDPTERLTLSVYVSVGIEFLF